jgi:glutamate/tyrosine decarboxylase-like PLP-dependent enzyme
MKNCDPRDIAIKSFFLGPQSENSEWLKSKWIAILDNWIDWRRGLFPHDGLAISPQDQANESFKAALNKLETELNSILHDLEKETPKFSPRYIGHMVSEISLPALLGHACALLHNPNIISKKVSSVVTRIEDEAISDLAKMLNFPASAQGHFTSGGTLANFEALWHAIVRADAAYGERGFLSLGPWQWAREYEQQNKKPFPGFVILVPGNKHYSWEKAVMLMGLGANTFWSVALDSDGRMDPNDLDLKIQQAKREGRPILMVVSVVGTTEMGEVDPVDEVQNILDQYSKNNLPIWHHVDAAYGGYFTTMLDSAELEKNLHPKIATALKSIARADSVTLDPHKLGYVPYACGAFLVRDKNNYQTRSASAAYLQTDTDNRWRYTLEGSRSGAGATATYLSNRVLGLNADGYGRLLNKGIEARNLVIKELEDKIPGVLIVRPVDLNIVCFSIAPQSGRLSQINETTEHIWRHFEHSPNFSVSKTVLHAKQYGPMITRMAKERQIELDVDAWHQIRLVLMNPFLASKETKTHFIHEFVKELFSVAFPTPRA